MKCIGILNSNKKSDNSPYCWLYYTEEKKDVDGLACDKLFFRKHIDDIQIGDEFELTFNRGNDGKYYPNGVKIV